jgi:hypothetical protein
VPATRTATHEHRGAARLALQLQQLLNQSAAPLSRTLLLPPPLLVPPPLLHSSLLGVINKKGHELTFPRFVIVILLLLLLL